MASILIEGASQGIGREAVKAALEAGHTVRAFSRSADRMTLDHPNLEKRPGDALSEADVLAALEGIDTVIQALGVPAGPDMVLRPIHLFSDATRVLLAAMQEAKVRRLIAVTGFGAGDSKARISCLQRIPFRLVLGRAYDDKNIQEEMIRNSDIDWVIARPVVLFNGPRTGRYRILEEPRRWRNGLISRADVADFLIDQVDSDRYVGKTPVLAY